jgi:hypothetical protein
MKMNLTMSTKLTVSGLIALAIALWTQWLSGDPAYSKFPPGPVVFFIAAGIIVLGVRWWWTPVIGALVALLVTAGFFARLHMAIVRLTHPGVLGGFAIGIWIGTVLQVISLAVTDVAGLVATFQNYRHRKTKGDGAQMACRFFGGMFVLMSVLIFAGRLPTDKYHNLMHLTWGALAVGVSYLGTSVAKRFCIGSGVFYLALGVVGLLIGNPSMNRAWHFGPMLLNTGDHIFHLVLGALFLSFGLFSGDASKLGRVRQVKLDY